MNNAIKGSLIASAVVGLFACSSSTLPAASPSGTASATVKCFGINSCKGQGSCGAPAVGSVSAHSCGQHTSCKGQGWLPTATAEECTTKGGKVL
jgi:hypothetical protein